MSSILCYTTEIAVEKTLTEIQRLLVKLKARQVLTDMNDDGVITSISFRIDNQFGRMTYRLPANIDKVFAVIYRNPDVPRKLKTMEQAARVAWRIVKSWLEAQVAFVEAEQVELEQVFLAYVQGPDGRTLYETLKDQSFGGLALPAPTNHPS